MSSVVLARKGFTIVELLIVIVVIAILAAVTIVAYNGIRNQAQDSALQSSVSQAAKKIASHATMNSDTLPASLATLNIQDTATTAYTYVPAASGTQYCVSAQRPGSTVAFAYMSTKGTSTTGSCITNRVTNPSVELGTTGWGLSINGSTVTQSATAALFGSQGMSVVTSSTSDSGASIPVSGTFTAGNAYTATVRMKALTAGSYSLSVQGAAGGSARDTRTLAAGQEATFKHTWTPSTTGSIVFYALRQGGQSGTATFYVDGAVLVDGSTGYEYSSSADGSLIWSGSAGSSTSIMPASML